MLFLIFICLIILSIIRPKSKKIFYVILLFMWFTAAFCTECADRSIYMARYSNYLSFSSTTEVGFNFLMFVFNKIGLTFDQFLMIAYAFIFGIYGWFIKKNTDRLAFVAGMYLIFSFCIDTVQLRNSIGFAITLIGVNELYKDKMDKKSYIRFVAFVLLGSLFHFSNIFFLILLLGTRYNIKKNAIITAVSSVILLLLSKSNLVVNIGYSFVGSRINEILGRVNEYTNHQINSMLLCMIISLLLIILCLYLAYRNTKIAKKMNIDDGVRKFTFIEKTINYQTLLFITIFMIPIIPDVYRIQRYGLLLGYLGCSDYKVIGCKKKLFDSRLYYLFFVIVVLLLFYLQIYKLGNIESTFEALMNNNKFIN